MIEINLLPGTGKKARGRSAGINLGGAFSGLLAQVKDPLLLSAVGAVVLAVVAIFGMWGIQQASAAITNSDLQKAVQDSIRYSRVIQETRKVRAQRDQILKQLELIKSIDDNRYTWPHIMDEVSRALPPYTWLTSLAQTSAAQLPDNAPVPPGTKKAAAGAKPAKADTVVVVPKLQFRIMGHTVDLQALTRFMKQLEASPFIENIQLVKSATIIAEGKEVTEFQLDADYETPDPDVIRTVPVALSVR